MAGWPDVRLVGFVGGTGGAAALMAEMARRLAGRGVRVALSVPDWEGTVRFADHCRARGIAVERTPLLRQCKGPAHILADALEFVGRRPAPVVHYHLTDNAPHHQFLRAMDLLRTPRVFVTAHSPYDGEPAPDSPSARRWAAFAERRVERVICISQRAYERQLEYGVPPERLALIYNGVDVERFASGSAAVAYARLGLPPGTPLVVICGRIAAQKRPLDAVQAFRAAAERCPDAHLVFVGEGPLAADVAASAAQLGLAGRVHLVGHRFDVEHWLAAATVWLLPTEAEGFSLAVLEAMAAGCPIVTTPCPGNAEVVRDEVNALLAPVGDTAALGRALTRLLACPDLRRDLAAAARHAAESYSLDTMVDQHLAVYQAALAPTSDRDPRPLTLRGFGWTAYANILAAAASLLGPVLP